jgi:type I protein arginine methyltransferase
MIRIDFQGKVVMDVGAGSGLLALFAAMAGAKKVYAVEASEVAHFARKLVYFNKYQNVVWSNRNWGDFWFSF